MAQAGDAQTSVLLVDDHPVIMEALATAFTAIRLFERIEKVRSLSAAFELLARDSAFALVIVDLHMSDSEGLDAVTRLREGYPDVPVMVFSGETAAEAISQAFDLGVRGYVTKDVPLEVVVGAVRMILAGSAYVPPHLVGPLLGHEAVAQQAPSAQLQITPRQQQVLALLLQGMPNKVIGNRLGMAEGTVKTHLNTIFRVLGARNRAQVILRARAFGLC